MTMLDSDDKEEKVELKKQWKACQKEMDRLYSIWNDVTDSKATRREGVHVEWDASQDTFDNATDLTVESVNTKQKRKKSVTMQENVTIEKMRKINKVSDVQSLSLIHI